MRTLKFIMVLGLGALVSACASDTSTGNAPDTPQEQSVETPPSVTVNQINVSVPQTLEVSERNSYYPGGDIVWRGEGIGDRHAQVKAIFDTAMARGTAGVNGAVPVRLDVQVERFHALTEKARYTTGGVHSIIFTLQLHNLTTGQAIGEPRLVRADLKAFGGQEALEEERRGQTQKVRITDHLAEVIRQELTTADGFKNPRLGFFQALNKL